MTATRCSGRPLHRSTICHLKQAIKRSNRSADVGCQEYDPQSTAVISLRAYVVPITHSQVLGCGHVPTSCLNDYLWLLHVAAMWSHLALGTETLQSRLHSGSQLAQCAEHPVNRPRVRVQAVPQRFTDAGQEVLQHAVQRPLAHM